MIQVTFRTLRSYQKTRQVMRCTNCEDGTCVAYQGKVFMKNINAESRSKNYLRYPSN